MREDLFLPPLLLIFMNSNFNPRFITFLLLALLILLVVFWIRKKIKVLNVPNVFLISGAVKTGKTLLSVHLAKKEYRRNVRNWYISRFFLKLGNKDVPLKPMFYSNIPVARVKFNILTMDIILQEKRIPDKSVVLIDEASLLADSTLCKDKYVNNKLMRFVKLFAHYSHGGKLIIDTQSISDLHFSFKRCMNNYLYIYSRVKYPFFTVMKVREMLYSDDGSLMNNSNEDIELSMRRIFILNRTYKDYDCYCYSSFTDMLPFEVRYNVDKLTRYDDMKCYQLVSFQDFAKKINKDMEVYLKDKDED